jgi:hypothetical protein
MKLCFVSVNGPREPYLLDEPRTYHMWLAFTSSTILLKYIIP